MRRGKRNERSVQSQAYYVLGEWSESSLYPQAALQTEGRIHHHDAALQQLVCTVGREGELKGELILF